MQGWWCEGEEDLDESDDDDEAGDDNNDDDDEAEDDKAGGLNLFFSIKLTQFPEWGNTVGWLTRWIMSPRNVSGKINS